MITNRTYYKGEIYIPQAKPTAGSASSSALEEVESFIEEYEEDCLIKCLGPSLYEALVLNMDLNETSLIDALAEDKWDYLMNGTTYVCPSTGKNKNWKGLRFKTPLTATEYNRSFLAFYVYYFYEQKQYITNTGTGHQIEDAKNAETVTPTNKVVHAWRKFVKMVQGENTTRDIYTRGGLVGVDYYSSENNVVSLYQFINDSNKIAENTYADFEPKDWELINNFGL